jgi:hypothetical protein
MKKQIGLHFISHSKVLVYLCLYRLSELTFSEFRKFVRTAEPSKMAKLVGFLFDSQHLHPGPDGVLYEAWCGILDHEYVKTKIVVPLLQHAEDAIDLVKELNERAEKGMVPRKSNRSPTGMVIFELALQTLLCLDTKS